MINSHSFKLSSAPWNSALSTVNLDLIDFLSEVQWLQWLEKELGIATTRFAKCLLAKLFEKAVSQCNGFNIWKQYCDFVQEDIEVYLQMQQEAPELAEPPVYTIPDQCLEIFERALEIHGGGFTSSQLLWNPYFQLCRTLGMPVDVLRQRFQDRLRIPHHALSDTFAAYSTFEVQVDPSNYEQHYAEGNAIYQATLADVQWMEEFEKTLEGPEKATHFLQYIARANFSFEWIRGMYERALSETNADPIVWTSYILWTLLQWKQKDQAMVLAMRASKECPHSAELACCALRLTTHDVSEDEKMLPSALYTMSTCADFSSVLLEFLRLHQSLAEPPQLRSLMKTGFAVRSQVFPVPTETPADLALVAWCLEYLYCHDEEGSELYDELLEWFSTAASHFKYWLPLLSAQLAHPPTRPLFSVAVERVKDYQDLVLDIWLEYAYRYQEVEDVEYVRNLITQHAAYVQYCQSLSVAAAQTTSTHEPASTRKRDHTEANTSMDVDQDRTDHTFVVKHVSARQTDYLKEQYAQHGILKKVRFLKSKTPGQQGQLFVQMDSKQAILNIFKHCQRDLHNEPRVFEMVKGASWDPQYLIRQELQAFQQNKLQQQELYLAHQDTTLFVANLAPSVTKDDLAQFFEAVEDVRLMQTKSGASKGYAYVQFQSVEAKEKGLQLHETVFKDRVMYVANSNPDLRKNKKVDQVKGSRVRDYDPSLVYVTNLPFRTTKKDLLELSHASEVRFVLDAKKRSRGIAFCQYSDEAHAQQAVETLNGLTFEGRILEASIAQPTRRGIMREDYEQKQPPLKESTSKAVPKKKEGSAPIPRVVIHRGPKKKVKLMSIGKPQEEETGPSEMNIDSTVTVKDNSFFRNLLLTSTTNKN